MSKKEPETDGPVGMDPPTEWRRIVLEEDHEDGQAVPVSIGPAVNAPPAAAGEEGPDPRIEIAEDEPDVTEHTVAEMSFPEFYDPDDPERAEHSSHPPLPESVGELAPAAAGQSGWAAPFADPMDDDGSAAGGPWEESSSQQPVYGSSLSDSYSSTVLPEPEPEPLLVDEGPAEYAASAPITPRPAFGEPQAAYDYDRPAAAEPAPAYAGVELGTEDPTFSADSEGEAPLPTDSRAFMREILLLLRQRAEYDRTKEKAFERLYDELEAYKGDHLLRSLRPLLMDLVLFYDFAEARLRAAWDLHGADSPITRELDSVVGELLQVLARQEVFPIEGDLGEINRELHRVIKRVPTDDPAEDGRITKIYRRGFLLGDQVLRPEEVEVTALRGRGRRR